MQSSRVRFGGLFLLLSVAATSSQAAELVLILRPDGTSWQIEDARRITFNRKDRLRAGRSGAEELSGDEYKKLTPLQILRAGVLRKHAAGYLARKDGDSWQPTAPDGANVKGATSYAALWESAQIVMETDRNAKHATPIRAADLFAILPGGDRDQAVADFLLDAGNFRGLGEGNADAALAERMSLLLFAAPSLSGPASGRVQEMLIFEMHSADQKLDSGVAHYSDLLYGLKFVELSQKVFPRDAAQGKARDALLNRKAWLAQRMAILKALGAGELWDAVLEKYGEFDRYDSSFPEFQKLRTQAFQESGAGHYAEGKRLFGQRQYDPALRELKVAQQRSPADQEIATLIERVAIERDSTRPPPPPPDPNSPEQIQIMRHVRSAEQLIDNKRLKEAEEEISLAERLNKESPSIMLARAKLLRASGQRPQALAMLDQYERRVRKEDWTSAEELRGQIVPELRTLKEQAKDAIQKAEANGDYPAALASAQDGLTLDGNDPFFLLRGGLNSAILRKHTEAVELLNQYLRQSQGVSNESVQRGQVYDAIREVRDTVDEPNGSPNWFSGYKSPPGVSYCPISLAFNAPVNDVRGSRKQVTSYTWEGDRLKEIVVRSEQPGEKPFQVYFDYYSNPRSVRRVSSEPIAGKGEPAANPRFTKNGPAGPEPGVYTALLNNPIVDPLMVEKLTGNRAAAIVTGNPYFHPFVWEGLYLFLVEYDKQGRVASAHQVAAGSQPPAALHDFEFRWVGWRLQEISERGSGSYHRTMTYAGDRLTGESISYNNAHSKIEYKYRGDHLVEADCTNDPSLEGRSRHVLFR